MGSGNLLAEMADLAELLATGGVTAPQAIQLHVEVLEELVRGLGNRSARACNDPGPPASARNLSPPDGTPPNAMPFAR